MVLQFDFSNKSAVLDDNGIPPFPATSIMTLAKAITTLLNSPAKIDGSFYHISDGVLTQQEILRIVERESGSPWKKTSFSIEAGRLEAAENMKKGIYGPKEFIAFLRAPFFGGLQTWIHVDNEVLGIKDEDRVDTRDEVARLAREHLQSAEKNRSRM